MIGLNPADTTPGIVKRIAHRLSERIGDLFKAKLKRDKTPARVDDPPTIDDPPKIEEPTSLEGPLVFPPHLISPPHDGTD